MMRAHLPATHQQAARYTAPVMLARAMLAALLVAGIAESPSARAQASPLPAGPAEERTRAAITMIEALDDRYGAVIALDPAAQASARRLDRQRRAPGLLHGEPVLLKDNIESIVCPASVNGVVGFKPTHGLVSGTGIVPLALTQDTAGPIAASVELAARTLAVIANPSVEGAGEIRAGLLSMDEPGQLRGLRIGVFANTRGFDPRRDAELQRSLAHLRRADAVLVPDLRIEPYEGFSEDSYDVLLWEFRRDLNGYLAGLPSALSSLTLEGLIAFNRAHAAQELKYFDQSIFLEAQAIDDSAREYRRKRAATREAMREDGLDAIFDDHELDALIGITLGPAWKIDHVNGDAFFGPGMARQAAIAGNPHITLPLGAIEGLPVGISLIGERWRDHRLAAIARLLDEAHAADGAHRPAR